MDVRTTCILFQWFQSKFNENLMKIYALHMPPKGLWIKVLVLAGSNWNNYSNFKAISTELQYQSEYLENVLTSNIEQK